MIDVVIPTYNRARALALVMDSYLAQEHLGRIIFVDDCSTDNTTEYVAELSRSNPGKIIYHRMLEKSTLPAVRNIGIGLSSSKFIFMGEDDVLLPPDHFKILLEKMNLYNADIISGRRINVTEGQTTDGARVFADQDREPIFVRVPFEAYFERPVDAARETYTLHSNSLMKRSVAVDVKYDPKFDGNAFREETDFYLRAHMKGFHLWLIPDTISYHMRNTAANSSGGSRKSRLVYEWQVWKNTVRLFMKNRNFFKEELGVKNIYFFLVRCLIGRYVYALKRRVDQSNVRSQEVQNSYET